MTFIGGYTVQGHSIAASLGADGNVSSRTVAFFVAQVRALRRASIDARMGRRAGSIELLCCQLLSRVGRFLTALHLWAKQVDSSTVGLTLCTVLSLRSASAPATPLTLSSSRPQS